MLVILEKAIPKLMTYKIGCRSNSRASDFSHSVMPIMMRMPIGIKGERTLVPCENKIKNIGTASPKKSAPLQISNFVPRYTLNNILISTKQRHWMVSRPWKTIPQLLDLFSFARFFTFFFIYNFFQTIFQDSIQHTNYFSAKITCYQLVTYAIEG